MYHRLNVIPIHIPPLRQRREDIPILVQAFVEDTCMRNGIAVKKISERAIAALKNMEWKGNVRELRNIVERLVIMSTSSCIEDADLGVLPMAQRGAMDDIISDSKSFQEFKDRAEEAFIKRQLELYNWHVSKTAEALQMERSHLYTKIKKYKLERAGKNADENNEQ